MAELIGKIADSLSNYAAVATPREEQQGSLILAGFTAVLIMAIPFVYLAFLFFVVYLIYKLIVVYIIPAIFGTKDKNVDGRILFNQNYPYMSRMGAGGIVGMNEYAATHLTARVTKAVAGPAIKTLQ